MKCVKIDLRVVDSIPPWYSPVTAKPMYESHSAHAYRDVPVSTLIVIVSEANRVDARIVDYKGKKAWAVDYELSVGGESCKEG